MSSERDAVLPDLFIVLLLTCLRPKVYKQRLNAILLEVFLIRTPLIKLRKCFPGKLSIYFVFGWISECSSGAICVLLFSRCMFEVIHLPQKCSPQFVKSSNSNAHNL